MRKERAASRRDLATRIGGRVEELAARPPARLGAARIASRLMRLVVCVADELACAAPRCRESGAREWSTLRPIVDDSASASIGTERAAVRHDRMRRGDARRSRMATPAVGPWCRHLGMAGMADQDDWRPLREMLHRPTMPLLTSGQGHRDRVS